MLSQRSIVTFDHCRLDVVIFTRVEMNIVSRQHRLKRSIHIFGTFVRLKEPTFTNRQYTSLERIRHLASTLRSQRNGPCKFTKDVDAG